jgi:hypothetical protein
MWQLISTPRKGLLVLKLSTGLRKHFSQLKSQLRPIQTQLISYRKRLNDWLYEKDITKRRIKHYAKLIAVGMLPLIAWLVVLFWHSQVADWMMGALRFSVKLLYSLGEELQMPSPPEFVTLIVADAVAVLGIGLVNVIFLRRLIRQPEPPEPDIAIEDVLYSATGQATTYALSVSNRGDTAALSCQARITFDSLDPRDILEIPKIRSRINAKTFPRFSLDSRVTLDKSLLPWISFPRPSFPQEESFAEEMDIRAGDFAILGVLKVVAAGPKLPAHFEFLSSTRGQATACFKLKHLYGKIIVTPLNGRPSIRNFQVTREMQTKTWQLAFA